MLDVDSPWAPTDDFNFAFLYCIPKAVSFVDPTKGDIYKPSATRPLSVVNTDNRCLANGLRMCFEQPANEWISKAQRGFLQGRHMLRNVLDVDFHSLKITLKRARGAIVLLDFEAAFPSMDHAFMLDTLSAIGVPPGVIKAVRLLYKNNKHWLRVKNAILPSVDVHSGVRQGCPLSPVLFAICVDVLLKKIASVLDSGHRTDNGVFAFADDTAVTIDDVEKYVPRLEKVFREFEAISGMRLNVAKTSLIPLWGGAELAYAEAKAMLTRVCPAWKGFQIVGSGTYLGFMIGPMRGSSSWNQALVKFKQRVLSWASIHLGMARNSFVFRSYCLPCLSFVGQLEIVNATRYPPRPN